MLCLVVQVCLARLRVLYPKPRVVNAYVPMVYGCRAAGPTRSSCYVEGDYACAIAVLPRMAGVPVDLGWLLGWLRVVSRPNESAWKPRGGVVVST